jgi:DNA modification methylase
MKIREIEASFQVTKSGARPRLGLCNHPMVQMLPTASLTSSVRNARTHSKKQIGQIKNSMRAFGWTTPMLVDENLIIIAGHGRYLAAIDLGLNEVPAIVVSHLTDAEKRALALADNKISMNAGWDRAKLSTELGELLIPLSELGLDITVTGFETAEFDGLATDFTDPEADPADAVPPIEQTQAISRTNDLWHLGDHRLYCGDACDETNLQRLMNGEQAAALITDPPYNRKIGEIVGRGNIKHREFLSGSGEMSDMQFAAFSRKWMGSAAKFCENGALAYIFMDWRNLAQIQIAGNEVFSQLKNIIVWVKTNAGQGSLYRSQHEFILLFKNGDGPHRNNIELGRHGRNRSNVWSYPGVSGFRSGRLDDLRAHPTVKPVALVADAIRDCTPRKGIVLDPFLGSGTTILAAEKIGRRAYGIEIDPLYVDVAIRRWQEFTKRDAFLATGESFDEVAAKGRTSTKTRRATRERL